MDKITVKDINKMLPIGTRIKVKSKRAMAIPLRIFSSVKKFFHKAKATLAEKVSEEAKNNALKQQIDKLETKRQKLYDMLGQMVEQDDFTEGKNKYYVDVVADEIIRLENKVVKRKEKGLGKFALAKLTLTNYLKNKREKFKLKRSYQKQVAIENEETEITSRLEELAEKKSKREEKIKAILTANPELMDYYTSLRESEETKETIVKTK